MNKNFRQGRIFKIVRGKEIFAQEELGRELGETADGYRQMSAESVGPDLGDVANECLLDIRMAQNLIVLRTSPGNANTLAIALCGDGGGG